MLNKLNNSMQGSRYQFLDSDPSGLLCPVLSRNADQALMNRPPLGKIVGWIDIEPYWKIADAAS